MIPCCWSLHYGEKAEARRPRPGRRDRLGDLQAEAASQFDHAVLEFQALVDAQNFVPQAVLEDGEHPLVLRVNGCAGCARLRFVHRGSIPLGRAPGVPARGGLALPFPASIVYNPAMSKIVRKRGAMEERYLSLGEACEVLGKSERTLYRWIKSGKLRAYKPGRDYEIPVSAIEEMREKSVVRPKASAPPRREERREPVEISAGFSGRSSMDADLEVEKVLRAFKRDEIPLEEAAARLQLRDAAAGEQ